MHYIVLLHYYYRTCVYICIYNMWLMVTVKVPSPSQFFLFEPGKSWPPWRPGVVDRCLRWSLVPGRCAESTWSLGKKPASSIDFPSKVHGNHDETHGKPVDLHVSTPSPNYWGSPLAAIPEKIDLKFPSPPTIRIELGGLGLVFMGVQQNPIDMDEIDVDLPFGLVILRPQRVREKEEDVKTPEPCAGIPWRHGPWWAA